MRRCEESILKLTALLHSKEEFTITYGDNIILMNGFEWLSRYWKDNIKRGTEMMLLGIGKSWRLF